jgi:hypothetical protein
MAENLNLKKTILIEDKEYDINAVYSDEAGRVSRKLTLMPSLVIDPNLKATKELTGDFDGSKEKEVLYVPATGGAFNGPVQINNGYSSLGEAKPNDIINYSQVMSTVSKLDGAPLWKWDINTGYNAIQNDDKIPVWSLRLLPQFHSP